MKINTNQQEVEYKGIFFTFHFLKKLLWMQIDESLLLPHCIHRTFNIITGKIERKYAWDAVLFDLTQKGLLQPILDSIIETEYLS